jgi:succinoglycan biosynthesis protein ExoM
MKYKVGIGICTFKRPSQLASLLESLLMLTDTEYIVIVIDNDKYQTARFVYNYYKGKMQLIYEVEEKQGLSNARNKCIDIVRNLNLNYIVFLDDDEIVTREDWLTNLINTAKKYNSPIVTGPILPLYEDRTKEYIKKAAFFSPPRYQDGTKLKHTGTGNTLIDISILKNMNPVFNVEFNLSGGEDTHLFMQLHKKGNTITWCDDAEVLEYIPLERANLNYIFKRSFYSAVNFSKIDSYNNLKNSKVKKILRIIKGMVKTIKGVCVCISFIFGGIHRFAQGLSMVGKGFGDIAGTFKINSNLYRD